MAAEAALSRVEQVNQAAQQHSEKLGGPQPPLPQPAPKSDSELKELEDLVLAHYLRFLDLSRQVVKHSIIAGEKRQLVGSAGRTVSLPEMSKSELVEWMKIPPPDPAIPAKFWFQRKRLWSKFEEGVQMDKDMWYSATHESIAKAIARRLKGVILDGLCGCGGNTIQFALRPTTTKVIAVEIDKKRLEMTRNNARVYGVEDKIEFVHGDIFEKLKEFKAEGRQIDAIFLAPPWGGQFYEHESQFDIRTMLVNGVDLFHAACEITEDIAFFLPRNVDREQAKMLLPTGCDIQQNRFKIPGRPGKVKSVTCYYGKLNPFAGRSRARVANV